MKYSIAYFLIGLWNHFFNKIPSYTLRLVILKYIYQMKIGKGSKIHYAVNFFHPWNIKLGNNSNIQSYSFIDGRGKCSIGNNCDIQIGVKIFTKQHSLNNWEELDYETVIEDYCVIGSYSLLKPNIKINKGGGSCNG